MKRLLIKTPQNKKTSRPGTIELTRTEGFINGTQDIFDLLSPGERKTMKLEDKHIPL